MCPLQQIGIWHFEAAIRTIIIITVGSGEQATEANTVASTQLDIADIDSMWVSFSGALLIFHEITVMSGIFPTIILTPGHTGVYRFSTDVQNGPRRGDGHPAYAVTPL